MSIGLPGGLRLPPATGNSKALRRCACCGSLLASGFVRRNAALKTLCILEN
jgi:hypothetical protein